MTDLSLIIPLFSQVSSAIHQLRHQSKMKYYYNLLWVFHPSICLTWNCISHDVILFLQWKLLAVSYFNTSELVTIVRDPHDLQPPSGSLFSFSPVKPHSHLNMFNPVIYQISFHFFFLSLYMFIVTTFRLSRVSLLLHPV